MNRRTKNIIEDAISLIRGFTLIEILVALVIISVAVLALGGFGISILSSGQVSRERLTAVHLAEQVLEHWQNDTNDRAPVMNASCVQSVATSEPSYPVTTTCSPTTGVGISYTIVVDRSTAQAPLPTSPNFGLYTNWAATNPSGTNPAILANPSNPNSGSFSIRNMMNYNLTGSPTPVVKVVTVTWSNKGKSRSVYLTHLSEVQ